MRGCQFRIFSQKKGMLRAFCGDWDGSQALPELDRNEVHHLVRVRRVRPGESIEILNGRGQVARCRVEEVSARHLGLRLEETLRHPPRKLRRHLLVALPKGKTFSALLQKMVELGADEITPLLTENSEVPPERAGKKAERWETVLVEGVKQSGNPWIPRLNTALPLAQTAGGDQPGQIRLCAALQLDARPLREVLQAGLPGSGSVQVFVGPEGDFSDEEYRLLRDSGCQFVSLGHFVLRVETAASLVMGTLGLWAD